jgi:hypothetical protein
MAKLPAGIFSLPRGKLSDDIWISPKTGKIYSPAPRHRNPRTITQMRWRAAYAICMAGIAANYDRILWPFRSYRVKGSTIQGRFVRDNIHFLHDVTGWTFFQFFKSSVMLWSDARMEYRDKDHFAYFHLANDYYGVIYPDDTIVACYTFEQSGSILCAGECSVQQNSLKMWQWSYPAIGEQVTVSYQIIRALPLGRFLYSLPYFIGGIR